MMNLADSEAGENRRLSSGRKPDSGHARALNLNQSGTFNQDQAVSLLTYLGFLTFNPESSRKTGMLHWGCPNEVCYQTCIA